MADNDVGAGTLTLWGTPHSLYTGKVRSYLLKKGLPFRERLPSQPRFQAEIVPAVGHLVVPVVECADGTLLQDSTWIIDVLEQRHPERPMLPATPLQRVLALLLDGYGCEGMLAAAMHYRWSYRAEQEQFLRAEFGRAAHQGPNREERLAAGAALMDYFNGFLPTLGVTAQTIPAIEAAHEALLDALDIHFQAEPYLLGGHPSVADFGFMAPLYAHLARDPVPAGLMKNRAPNVYRWTERMNLAAIADGEFPGHAPAWHPDDTIPSTLLPVLQLLFADWGAQLQAEAAFTNAWLEANAALPPGSLVAEDGRPSVHPAIGAMEYPWRGVKVQRGCMPHGLWHFERAAAAARALAGEARERLDALLQATGGVEVMQLRTLRPLERRNNLLVLG